MDPERQPLLRRAASEPRPQAPRALTAEGARRRRGGAAVRWRSLGAVLLWALAAALMALAASSLLTPGCAPRPPPRRPALLGSAPAVPPVLRSLAPLVARVREQDTAQQTSPP